MPEQFIYCNDLLRNYWEQHGFAQSKKFCSFFSYSFEAIFTGQTGIKPSHKVTLAGKKQDNDIPMYQPGEISKINLVLWIMPEFYDNISFCWKSKSGKIGQTTDEEFDETDLDCWIEGLKPQLYWKEVSTEKKEHPFQIKNLPYTLKVLGFATEMGITIQVESDTDANYLTRHLSQFIANYNDMSEAKERKYGVVHQSRITPIANGIPLRTDTGSAGVLIVRKILKELTRNTNVKEVVLDF